MRKEYITFPQDMPIDIVFASIKEYPFHWHNCIQIIFVLEGTIKVTIESGTYELVKNDLEIINVDETHRIFSNDKNNKVLIFYFDINFFEKYYNDMENIFFYTNTSDDGAQASEEYDELRTMLSILLCEAVQKQVDYDEEIESTLVDLLYHLINNFHYLMYEQEDFRENKDQLGRYHRIAKYIYNNYNNKISLQDIAEKEFLSTHYLSHEIKYAMGYSFTDLLNLTRVEESVKLLLDTDKTISEISKEVGFSHTRYYNKHFKIHFKSSPSQFRKKYKVDEETFQKQKKIVFFELKDSLDYIYPYLQNYDRYNFENKIVKVRIDVDDEIDEFDKSFKDVINIGDAFDLLLEDNKDILEEIQEEISFNYGRIFNLFSSDMGIFPSSKFFNWNRTKSVLEYMESINLKPLILIGSNDFSEDEFIRILKSFINYFMDIEGIDIYNLKFQFSSNLKKELIDKISNLLTSHEFDICDDIFVDSFDINLIYDTAYMIPYIINKTIVKNKNWNNLRAFDTLDSQVNLTNEVFFGYPGIVNDMGIKKPSYYAYYLLNKLGDIVVCSGDGYIVTKTEDEYQILLYSYNEDLDKLVSFEDFSKLRGFKNNIKQKLSLNILNIPTDVRMTVYEVNEKIGSSYNYWKGMGSPIRLNKEEKEILHKASFPKIHFRYAKKSTVLNIISELQSYGATLILIKKISKHLK
ncbi:helix-turn-helix domain-containing protein [Clostridium cochlearium]|uniref:Transcriptional regulatory protein n=1 Tax=Clostridium cochlearium TaxID=1494 RepID=A0A2X2VXX8_CLOCO|nr:helix-turn-helix domain-containing protein [Clostridium cochlearium]SQB33264.1 transcriptional regulatory protein [Clostridium cochlearium]